jgi:hypothetical protein
MLRRLLLAIKLPWLLWMSIWDIHRVRNRLIGLFMGGGEALVVAPHESTFGTRQVKISSGSNPMFEFVYAPVGFDPKLVRCWLCLTGRWTIPSWTIGMSQPAVRKDQKVADLEFDLLSDEDGEPIKFKFNHEYARIPAALVKAYLAHFPFVGTDNYIVRDET